MYSHTVIFLCFLFSLSLYSTPQTRQSAQHPCLKKKQHPHIPAKKIAVPTDNTQKNSFIAVKNDITSAMTTYPHWTKNYTPDFFSVWVNDIPLQEKEMKTIPTNDKNIKITYEYSFMKGYKREKRDELIEISDFSKPISLQFSWDNKPKHIIIK